MKKPEFGLSDDYAILATENASFYYGYEETDGDEWCFVAKIKGLHEEIKVPFSKLGAKDQWDCSECLMVGIGWFVSKYPFCIPPFCTPPKEDKP